MYERDNRYFNIYIILYNVRHNYWKNSWIRWFKNIQFYPETSEIIQDCTIKGDTILNKKNICKKVAALIVLILMLLISAYWFIPIKFAYRANIKLSDVYVMSVYRHGYFDEKLDTHVAKITDKEKLKEFVNYLSNISTTKRFSHTQSISEDSYEYVIACYTTNKKSFMIYVNNKTIQIFKNNKDLILNINPKANVLRHLDAIFNN